MPQTLRPESMFCHFAWPGEIKGEAVLASFLDAFALPVCWRSLGITGSCGKASNSFAVCLCRGMQFLGEGPLHIRGKLYHFQSPNHLPG